MPLVIQPLEECDIPIAVRIELEAFRSHPRTPMMWPRGYTDDLYTYCEYHKLKSFHDPNSRLVKAVDQKGRIIAVSEWTLRLDPSTEEPIPDPDEQRPNNWPLDGNWEMSQFFKLEWARWKRQALAGIPYIVLDFLVVDPQSQGMGAGSRLLAWGTEQADRHKAVMCLESTPAGLPVYERAGFKEVRVLKADMKQYGWKDDYDEEAAKRVWMRRDPHVQ